MVPDLLPDIQDNLENCNATLIAVSKKQPDARIEASLNRGYRIFGENRVQEAQARWAHRRAHYPDLQLHMIGPLQTNKVKQAAALFDVLHTLDRESLAQAIAKHCPAMPCFIQVNTGQEPQKAGIDSDALPEFTDYCRQDLKLDITGLMCIPPVNEPAGLHFGLLADLANSLKLPHLSMGMSQDYDLALQYGATHIRIGSLIFGERQ